MPNAGTHGPWWARWAVRGESGQTMAEYAVVLTVVAITTTAVFVALSGGVANAITNVTALI